MAETDDFEGDGLELARCAQINFKNVVKMVPVLAMHPIFTLATRQLDAAVRRLEAEDAEA